MPELNGAVSPRAADRRVCDLVKCPIHPLKQSSLQLKSAKVLWLRLLPEVPIYYLGVAHPAYAHRGSAIRVVALSRSAAPVVWAIKKECGRLALIDPVLLPRRAGRPPSF